MVQAVAADFRHGASQWCHHLHQGRANASTQYVRACAPRRSGQLRPAAERRCTICLFLSRLLLEQDNIYLHSSAARGWPERRRAHAYTRTWHVYCVRAVVAAWNWHHWLSVPAEAHALGCCIGRLLQKPRKSKINMFAVVYGGCWRGDLLRDPFATSKSSCRLSWRHRSSDRLSKLEGKTRKAISNISELAQPCATLHLPSPFIIPANLIARYSFLEYGMLEFLGYHRRCWTILVLSC